MRHRKVLLVAALAGCALASLACDLRAADPPVSAVAEQRRRYLAIVGQGTLPDAKGATDVKARVRRGQATALEQPVAIGADGAFRCELRTTGRLLPDEYALELVRADVTLASAPFRVGEPDEVAPARERLRLWLAGARRTVRGFSSLLERQALYHQAQVLSAVDSAAVVQAQQAAWENVRKDFAGKFRAARMDFALYEREVILSPFDAAGRAIADVFAAVDRRRRELDRAFEDALSGRKTAIVPSTEIRALAASSAKGLALEEDDLAFWDGGPLGAPEAVTIVDGVWKSRLGFSIAVVGSWTLQDPRAQPFDDPHVRIYLTGPAGMLALVRVLEMPEARSWEDVKKFVNVLSWEEWGGKAYKLLESGDIEAGAAFRIHAQVLVNNRPERLLAIECAPASGRRLYELQVRVPEAAWLEHKAEAERLAAGFRVER